MSGRGKMHLRPIGSAFKNLKHRYLKLLQRTAIISASAVLTVSGMGLLPFTQLAHADPDPVFSGTITDSNSSPQSNVRVTLSATPWNGSNAAGSDFTDGSGNFSMSVSPGVYYLTVSTNSGNPRFELTQSTPGIDLTGGDVTQDLQLKTTTVHVSVKKADGSPVSGASVLGNAAGGFTTTLYTGDPGVASSGALVSEGTTNSSGNVDLTTFIGTTYNASPPAQNYTSICATIDSSVTCLPSTVTVSGETSVTITQPSLNNFSGSLTDSNDSPQSDVKVILSALPWNGSNAAGFAFTDSSGNFSVDVNPGNYYLTLLKGNSYTLRYEFTQHTPGINLTGGDLVQDLQLKTAVLHVEAKNFNGTPAGSGIHVLGVTSGNSTTLYPGDPGETASGSLVSEGDTDSSGTVDLTTVVGATYQAGPSTSAPNICATIEGDEVCLAAPLSVVGDTTVVLRQAPRNLAADSPTQAPHLTWDALSSATSYNIYRDNALVGNSSTNSYTDTTVGTGEYTYYVTGVNATGESGQSNTVTVVVDKTGPTVTVTAPTVNQTVSGASVTVSGTASDNTGIKDNQVKIQLRAQSAFNPANCGSFVGSPFYATVDGSGNWSTTFDSTQFSDGKYCAQISVTDNVGNTNGPNGYILKFFNINNSKPVVAFTAPSSFTGPFSPGPTVSITASDGNGLSVMVIHVYNSSNQLLNVCPSANSTQLAAGAMSCNLSGLAPGVYYIKAGATDNGGKTKVVNSGNFTIN